MGSRLLECFRLLELPPDASVEQVRVAYRTLSRVWHPDRFSGSDDLVARATARQQELNTAYRELLRAYQTGAAPIYDAHPDDAGHTGAHEGSIASGSPTDPTDTARWRRLVGARTLALVLGIAAMVTVLAGVSMIRARASLGAIPPSAVDASAVGVGAGHGCTARDSVVVCWGRGGLGQTGAVRAVSRAPVQLALPAAVQQVEVGLTHSCALLEDGSVYCWGGNFAGQLGDGSLEDRPAPAPIRSRLPFVELSTLGHHACGVTRDGALYCWGNDTDGQLGTGAPVASCQAGGVRFFCTDLPQRVRAGPWRAVAAGGSHTCAIDGQGMVWCWGSNRHGQLGAVASWTCAGPGGEQPCSRAPVRVVLDAHALAVVAGASHTCVLDHEGRATCWGSSRYGQTGTGSHDDVATASSVLGDLRFQALAAGGYHTCGLTADDEVHCWGRNQYRELGVRPSGQAARSCHGVPCTTVPILSADGPAAGVAAGFGVTCARGDDDRVACWGRGEPTLARDPSGATAGPRPGTRLRAATAAVRYRAASIRRFFERLLSTPVEATHQPGAVV